MPAARKPKPSAASGSITNSPVSPIASMPPIQSINTARAARKRNDTLSSDDPAYSPSQAHNAPAPSPESSWTEPPFCGFIESTEDALLILEASRRRMIPRVTRRLADRERKLIQSGSVFVFEEEESGIKRWTDGCLWSPSRILGNFLLYRETDKRASDPGAANRKGSTASSLLVNEVPDPSDLNGQTDPAKGTRGMGALSRPKGQPNGVGPLTTSDATSATSGSPVLDRARERILLGSLTNSYKFKEDGMMKKTFSITLPNSNKTHHLVSYYKVSDVEAGRLRTPSSLPELQALDISPDFLEKTQFRVPLKLEVGEDGRVRFRGENRDEPDSPPPESSFPPSAGSIKGRHGGYDNIQLPYTPNGSSSQAHAQYALTSDGEQSYVRTGNGSYLTPATYSPSSAAPWSPSPSTNGIAWPSSGNDSHPTPPMTNGASYQQTAPASAYPHMQNGSSGYSNGYHYPAAPQMSNPPPSPAYASGFSQPTVVPMYNQPIPTANGYNYQQNPSSGYASQPTSPALVQPPSSIAAAYGNQYPYAQAGQYDIPPPSRPSTTVSHSNGIERSSTSSSMSNGDDSSYYDGSVEPQSTMGSGSSGPASTAHSASPDDFDRPMSDMEDQRMMSVSSGSPVLGYDNLSRRSSMVIASPISDPQLSLVRRGSSMAGVVSNMPIKLETEVDGETQFAFSRSGRGSIESPVVSRNGAGAYVNGTSNMMSGAGGVSGWAPQEAPANARADMYGNYGGGAVYSSSPAAMYPHSNGYTNITIPPSTSPTTSSKYHAHSRNGSMSSYTQSASSSGFFSPSDSSASSVYSQVDPSSGYFGYNGPPTATQPTMNGHHQPHHTRHHHQPYPSTSSTSSSVGYHSSSSAVSSGSSSSNSSPYSDSHAGQQMQSQAYCGSTISSATVMPPNQRNQAMMAGMIATDNGMNSRMMM